MAINYNVTKYAVMEPGNLIASNYGEHMVSLNITEDTPNGYVCKVGTMSSLDLWEIEEASEIDAYIALKQANGNWLVVVNSVPDDLTAIVYQEPLIEEETPRALTLTSNFYNSPDDGPVRGYILHALDRFALSDEGFDGTPAVGATITSISDGKLVISSSES